MKFAKLFEYGKHQLLIKKTFGDDQEPEIECTTVVKGLKITNTLGFSNKNKNGCGEWVWGLGGWGLG